MCFLLFIPRDPSDIVAPLQLAPYSKRAMHLLKYGGVECVFSVPSESFPGAKMLNKQYSSNLSSQIIVDEAEVETRSWLDGVIDSPKCKLLKEERHDPPPPPLQPEESVSTEMTNSTAACPENGGPITDVKPEVSLSEKIELASIALNTLDKPAAADEELNAQTDLP